MALMSERYDFGRNWASFIDTNFSAERRSIAKQRLLGFLKRRDLKNLSFLDIGSGSGLHSMAAYDAGAARIHSFDYDEVSVQTTARLKGIAGAPSNWTVERGDVLDLNYLQNLGLWDIVYSWGVLHHTGAMWNAIDNAASRVASDGLFFIALYSSNVASPSTEFWLDVKRRYNRADAGGKRRMELWYLWRFGLDGNPLRLPLLIKQIYQKKKQRGMSYMTDVRDWLGGWPMEYANDQEVIDVMKKKHSFALVNISTGEACTEFLFVRTDATFSAAV
jgi:2-polyprenyl-6-hydroxyphenyl methylase/3-demethylubiquinone-9 3-methyltransferase